MDMFENVVNRRLIEGNLPLENLVACTDYCGGRVDFIKESGESLDILKRVPEMFWGFFATYSKRVNELEQLPIESKYINKVNFLINTGYSIDSINVICKEYQDAVNLIPVVTKLDKILWFGIMAGFLDLSFDRDNENRKKREEMMYAWIFILLKVQEKELQYGYTINAEKITSENICQLLLGEWNKVDHAYINKLTDLGKKNLLKLKNERKNIQNIIDDNVNQQSVVAKRTDNEWITFIDVINHLSQTEHNVISVINDTGSAREKIKAINGYKSIIRNILSGRYSLADKEINLLQLHERVNDRFQKASQFCCAKIDGGEKFVLHPAVFIIAMNPYTYNYLFMTYHHFRIDPNKKTAKTFFENALSCLHRNFNEPDKKWMSIDEMVFDFVDTVRSFVNINKTALDRLSFKSIQSDSVALDGVSIQSLGMEKYSDDVAKRLKEFENSEKYDEAIERLLEGESRSFATEDIIAEIAKEEKRMSVAEEDAFASQIIVSLNIIYMFIDALRIILTNRHASVKVKDKNRIEACRRELMKMDDKLVHKVYEDLDAQEMGILEYREKRGIIATSLSEQEQAEEAYRNSVFSQILKDAISNLANNIENQDTEQLIRTKACIKEEILRFPECDEKDLYAEWLDEISNRLSNALVQQCKQKKDDYVEFKDEIIHSLGEESLMLPESTVDSLTTAEILYKRYATEDYAKKGFDFSCISALYYQAFEDAYNSLIWKNYAGMLNALVINGQSFTSIMDTCRNRAIRNVDACGYLDSNPKQRGFYLEYANATRPSTVVSSRCMYKSFAILMGNVCISTTLDKFCDYFAKTAGYDDKDAMFNDSIFMKKCQDFTAAVDGSVLNRNNASHGGTFISVEQCGADKKTVLYDVESLRNQSIGLIQQLIELMRNRTNNCYEVTFVKRKSPI